MITLVLVVLATVAPLVVGTFGIRYAKTPSNFFVASRSVPPAWNAFAICGEYMSAGSYLGLAGLILVFGVDIMWLPIGWTAGYLLLLLFVAAPLRRFGAYTIPEFAEGRMESPGLRRLAAVLVLVISWLYLLPQMKGAGIVLRQLAGLPFWVGVLVIGVVAAINLTSGGMRSITFIQGFQYFVIMFGVLAPLAVIAVLWGGLEHNETSGLPTYDVATQVEYTNDTSITVTDETTAFVVGVVDGSKTDGPLALSVGDHLIGSETVLTWPAGSLIAHESNTEPLDGATWSNPFGDKNLAGGHPLYFAHSALLASMLGTMGLPHVLVRFYTNPNGRAARRTTVWVLALLAPYYAVLPLYGALGRLFTPELLSNGETDTVSVLVTKAITSGTTGAVLTAIIAAGAVSAMLSTSSGLLIAVAGAISHDLAGGGVRQFRQATWFGALVAVGLGLLSEPFDISILVSWAFAIAASSFCPLLVMGIWWRGLTARGAAASIIIGGGTATLSIVATMVGLVSDGWGFALLSTPAAWTVPLAFLSGVLVSLADPNKVPDVSHKMAILHMPDQTGISLTTAKR